MHNRFIATVFFVMVGVFFLLFAAYAAKLATEPSSTLGGRFIVCYVIFFLASLCGVGTLGAAAGLYLGKVRQWFGLLGGSSPPIS